jgi:hypothetical protein
MDSGDDKVYALVYLFSLYVYNYSIVIYSVIVSQWTALLDIVEYHLKKERGNIHYTRVDGKVAIKERQPCVSYCICALLLFTFYTIFLGRFV